MTAAGKGTALVAVRDPRRLFLPSTAIARSPPSWSCSRLGAELAEPLDALGAPAGTPPCRRGT
ncbi:hypothetical protein WJ438_04060 [Streptomyces sp. GD-15H]|uniref:hypothetical protein n=1 Tax=Streptomyces sp. GD-15H TaxID=3129112 RepID=UPI00324B5813